MYTYLYSTHTHVHVSVVYMKYEFPIVRSYKEPDHSLRDKVAKDYIKQRNRDMITRRKKYQEK